MSEPLRGSLDPHGRPARLLAADEVDLLARDTDEDDKDEDDDDPDTD